jgi:plastocyanin
VRRTGAVGALVVAALVVAAPAGAVLASPARLQVGATEFRFTLSRLQIKRGPAIVELVNRGQDDHDLRLRRIGGTKVWKLPRTKPGERAQLSASFAAGTFRLWCSLPGHRLAGMRTTLRVVR